MAILGRLLHDAGDTSRSPREYSDGEEEQTASKKKNKEKNAEEPMWEMVVKRLLEFSMSEIQEFFQG
ncbi:hypothetical protein J6590_055853 [Homalodisca vitripennis]|nr:hypothetical protein J6590_055853 [Homalodisca vitripennis]